MVLYPFEQCAEKAPKIKLLSLPYSHKTTVKSMEMVDLMNGLTGVMDKENEKFPSGSKVFAHSGNYVNYLTMEIITVELVRNIGLALICVFFATMFLLAHLVIREKCVALDLKLSKKKMKIKKLLPIK